MTVYSDITSWAATRPWWQQQALVTLASTGDDAAFDYEALVHSMLSTPPATPPGGWLAGIQQPLEQPASAVSLVSIHGVDNVNRLVAGQTLTFAPSGVTVIYGNNGSGKSGYARLVKSLVRTRDAAEVLPDIFRSTSGSVTAALSFFEGGTVATVRLGDEAPPSLQQITFYDERCGDLYVSKEGEASYRPSALALFDGLIRVCDTVRAAIDSRLADLSRNRVALPELDAATPAAQFLSSLNADTTDDEIASACTVSRDAEAEIERARSEEARLRATDPTTERTRIEELSGSYLRAAQLLAEARTSLDAVAERQLRTLQSEAAEARQVARAMAAERTISDPLDGVGSALWRTLWLAAERYSATEVYPEHEFPNTDEGAACPLCQQHLDSAARDRLTRFQRLMTDTSESIARRLEERLDTEMSEWLAAGRDGDSLALTLRDLDEPLAAAAAAQYRVWGERRDAVEVGRDALPDEPNDELEQSLRAKSAQYAADAILIDTDTFNQRVHGLVTAQRELAAAIALAGAKRLIMGERDRVRQETALREARRDTDTRGISRTLGDLTAKHVTVVVQDRFSRESQDLQVDSVTLRGQGVRHGSVLHKPEFVGAHLEADLPRVLSEGEQTALGLAGYFVEAHLDASMSSLVLDDPVTSLDHLRRERVARRLIEFAKSRQVIVFTHDAVFAGDLRRAASEEGVEYTARSVERRGLENAPGYCHDDHPWKAKDAASRLHSLREDLARMRRESTGWDDDTRERAIGSWSGRLSETWERIVSQEIAGQLFDRGTEEVRPTMLKVLVKFNEDDDKVFQEAYKRVSRWATRHDKSTALNYVPPSFDELSEELDIAKAWFERVKKFK